MDYHFLLMCHFTGEETGGKMPGGRLEIDALS